jgi:hypothetical protein
MFRFYLRSLHIHTVDRLIVGNYKVKELGGLQWHKVHIKFHGKWIAGSKDEMG